MPTKNIPTGKNIIVLYLFPFPFLFFYSCNSLAKIYQHVYIWWSIHSVHSITCLYLLSWYGTFPRDTNCIFSLTALYGALPQRITSAENMGYFLHYYLTAPRPPSGHWRGCSFTKPMLITALDFWFGQKDNGSFVRKLASKTWLSA